MKVIARDYFLRQAEISVTPVVSGVMKTLAEVVDPSVTFEHEDGQKILDLTVKITSIIQIAQIRCS